MKQIMTVMVCVLLAGALAVLGFLGFALFRGEGGAEGIGVVQLAKSTTFSIEGLDEVRLQYRSDHLTILPAEGDEIVLEEYSSHPSAEELARVSQVGGRLTIEQGERQFRLFTLMYSSYAKLYLPAGYTAVLELESKSGGIGCEMPLTLEKLVASSSSGNLHFEDIDSQTQIYLSVKSGGIRCGSISAAEEVTLSSSSGGVECETIRCEGDVELRNKSGSLRVEELTAQNLRAENTSGGTRFGQVDCENVSAKASSGSLVFGRLQGQFNLESTSGSVRVEGGAGYGRVRNSSGGTELNLEELKGNLALESSSGSLRLRLPKEAGIDFSAETNSGGIHTPFDEELRFDDGGDRATGQVGSGPYHEVSCTTSSGGIKLEWR